MTNRRELLKIGLAASAAPFVGASAFAVEARSADAIPLYKVLYDARFWAGTEFGRRAAANGHAVVAIHGDMTRFWYDDLYHRWRDGPAAIAGLTARGALFCFEQLARAERMRVVLRVEHIPEATCVAHTIEGPGILLPAVADALATRNWAAGMADVVAQCSRGVAERRTATARTPAFALAATESLVSWVIAPVRRS